MNRGMSAHTGRLARLPFALPSLVSCHKNWQLSSVRFDCVEEEWERTRNFQECLAGVHPFRAGKRVAYVGGFDVSEHEGRLCRF